MALSIDDLKRPKGRLDVRTFWPRETEDDVDAILQAYLSDGVKQATAGGLAAGDDRDAAAIEWAYWRAFDEVHTRLLINPSSIDLPSEGAANWLLTQIQDVRTRADDALSAFEEIVTLAIGDEEADVGPVTRSSACILTTFVP